MATTTSKNKRKSQQRQAVIRILIIAAILVCVNVLASRLHYGLDLTKEKRFTLSPATKNLLRNIDDVVVIEVYLEGKFNANLERMQDAVRERLESFKQIAGAKIIYKFIDPFEGKAETEKGPIYQDLAKKGVIGEPLTQTDEEGYSEKIYFPYALVQYKGKAEAVHLVETHMGLDQAGQLNKSESLLEYKFANAIHRLNQPDKKYIAYITGNGQPEGLGTLDMLYSLGKVYKLDTVDLSRKAYISELYDAIIINKPTVPFNEQDKFKLDQYVMYGGHILWAIDALNTPLDSLQPEHGGQMITTDYNLNLDDMLFNYGARINPDLIEDADLCISMPVMNGYNADGSPRITKHPWVYFPVFLPTSKHPIVNNMDGILTKFTNSIDTSGAPGIQKTILLASSKYSRTAQSPVRVSLGMTRYKLRPELFNKPYRPAAVLLEGKFKSIFQNRIPSPNFQRILRDSLRHPFKTVADSATSMIVISDGDIFENGFTQSQGPEAMGYWRYDNYMYANRDFLMNCIEYLTDKSTIMEARTKDVKLRILDTARVKEERNKWRFVNIGIPIAIILVFASAYQFFRKRRYETKK